MLHSLRILSSVLAILFLLAACTPVAPTSTQSGQQASPSGTPVQVVATTNFVADWARVVGGSRVEVFSLLPVGGDPHTFLPGARDVARVADADLVLTVGLGLEADWLQDLLHNASADESRIVALGEGVDPIEFTMVDMHDDHEAHGDDDHEGHDHDDDHEAHDDDDHEGHDHDDDHGDQDEMITGRLLVADAVEAHLSVIDLSTGDVDSGIFKVAAPRATVYPSPTHRYAIVLARGPEDGDDRIHVFDSGVFLVEHGDHYDLVTQPVSRHALEIADEQPIHYVNSHGWTAIFADISGHAILINEADLANARGDYDPVVLEAGPQHGAALVISDEHVVVTTKNPDYPENSNDSLPVGAEVRDFSDQVVYDASNRSCPGMHGESHNEHGVALGCTGGVLYLHVHDGEYEHEFIANPAEMRADSRIGSVYGHHHVEHFFGKAFYFDGEGFADDGIWLIDVDHSEMRQVFSEPSVSTKFSSDGELLYVLGTDGVLHALDAHDGELLETMELVGPGDAGRPAFIVVGEWLYVADPNSGRVMAVHLEEMEIEEEWEVGGAPSSLAFVGLVDAGGAPHEGHDEHDEDEHGHDEHEEDEHGHDEHDEDEHGHEGHHHGPLDPHFWFDPIRVKVAVNEVAARLSAIDPEGAETYLRNAAEYGEQLDELHAWVQEQVSAVAPERRLLVTSHDAFSYFAALYGFEIVGLVIPSLATHVEPSAEHIADVVEVVREHEIPALFGETTVSERLAQTIATETGAELFRLFSGSLGPEGSGADTYLGMVRTNVERIVEALK
ncbi:MAG: zinc ABC transporter substrate-binding protein [Caldilineaceae bacterium]|nr:zinc ABC transporter substrate-binding protein [Caldilineaceae bacterium]